MENEVSVLKRASEEIRTLRRQNELMASRLDMFDKMMLLFTSIPLYPTQGYSPDIVYEIDKLVASRTEVDETV